MKSAIYVANTSAPTGIATGASLPLGNIVRRFGCNCDMRGNGIVLSGQGYYDVDFSATFTPSAADTITVQLYKDGVAIPGARAIEQGSNAINIEFPALVRQSCCNSSGVLTFVVTTGTDTTTLTMNNLSAVVGKL